MKQLAWHEKTCNGYSEDKSWNLDALHRLPKIFIFSCCYFSY